MRRIALIGLIGMLATACGAEPGRDRPPVPGRVMFRTSAGTVETASLQVADTESERERGLMGRSRLPADAGMVFLFTEPTESGFWMKDTLIPLSIAFWNEQGVIVDILDMRPCRSDPCRIYTPRAPYVVALEMNLGWFEAHRIGIGDHAELSYSSV